MEVKKDENILRKQHEAFKKLQVNHRELLKTLTTVNAERIKLLVENLRLRKELNRLGVGDNVN
jgi:hypothetical protein